MHPLFGRAAAETHPDVLERAAEARGLMALHMRHHHHRVGIHGSRADAHRVEVAALDRDVDRIAPVKPVGDDERRVHGREREAVVYRTGEMVHGVRAFATIEGVRIGKERLAAGVTHAFDHLAKEHRMDETGVALFAEVQFDRNQVALGDRGSETSPCEQPTHAAHHAALHARAHRREEDLRGSLSFS